MRKSILLLVVLMIMGSMCYAADDSSEDSLRKINLLLNQNKQLDDQLVYEIGNLASEISTNDQMLLLSQHEQSPWGPFALNFFLGFGIGSFVQGNSNAGWIELGLDGLGYVLLISGLSSMLNSAYDYDPYSSSSSIEGAGSYTVGLISIVAGRLVGLISPFTFANEYNKNLKNALYSGGFSAVPKIDQEGNMGMELAFSIPLK